MSEWISVETELPEIGASVLISCAHCVRIGEWTDDVYKFQGGSGGPSGFFGGDYADNFGDRPIMLNPTHWMKLPSPPNAKA